MPVMNSTRSLCRLVLALATLAAVPAVAGAQVGQLPLDPRQIEELRGGLGGMDDERAARAGSPQLTRGPLLEGEISRTEYRLGPGDVLTLAIFGYRSETHTLAVAPEGTVVIPAVGIARVGGLNLEQAQQAVARQVRRFNRDAEVSLSLAAVRSFKVFLIGDVADPGMREATAVTRVSELFPARRDAPGPNAGELRAARNPDGVIHRNVTLRRSNGSIVRVDLARFLQLGELAHNPMLREGDVVHVPTVDRTVTILGQVAFPGVYEYLPSETLGDLLRIANGGGPFRADAADTIRLMRFSQNPRGEVRTYSREEATGLLGSQLLIEPFDALFIPRLAHFGQATTATIEGEVRRPGTYPIQPAVTTIQELVEMAGGFTPEASLIDAVLRRAPVHRPRDDVRLLQNVPPEYLSRDEIRVMQVTERADAQTVVVDFARLFNHGELAYNLPLQSGDEVYVPQHRHEVTVLGGVVRPGIVSFQPGAPLGHYVAMAGGFTRSADQRRIVIIRANSGSRLEPSEVDELAPGDRIVVPFRERIPLLERVQTVSGVVNTVAGAIVTIYGISRIWASTR
jgi:polysaccharide biosynthesis/export protein